MNLSPETIIAAIGYFVQFGVLIGVMRSNAESTREQLKLLRNDMDARIGELREDLSSHRTRVHELGNQSHAMAMQVITTLAQIVADAKK
jgi:hypothetical protein